MTAPVFVVADFAADGARYVLDGPEGRHAVSVTRLEAGEEVVLTDGAGSSDTSGSRTTSRSLPSLPSTSHTA